MVGGGGGYYLYKNGKYGTYVSFACKVSFNIISFLRGRF